MPRSTQSFASRVIAYFESAPDDEVKVVYSIVKEKVAARYPIAKTTKKGGRPAGSKNKVKTPTPASDNVQPTPTPGV